MIVDPKKWHIYSHEERKKIIIQVFLEEGTKYLEENPEDIKVDAFYAGFTSGMDFLSRMIKQAIKP